MVTRRGVLAGGTVAGLAAFAPATLNAASRPSGVAVSDLKVELLDQPLGIDMPRPRFGWRLQARENIRGVRQTASQIQVAGDPDMQDLLSDSGRIAGARCPVRPDRDLPFAAQATYWWRVRIWDQDGAASAWSAPQRFVTGVIGDWQADWIAAGPDWPIDVGRVGRKSEAPAGQAMPLFAHRFRLEAAPRLAILSICGLGHHHASLNGKPVTDALLDPAWSDYRRHVYYATHDVTALLAAGDNRLDVMLGNGMYNSEPVKGRFKYFVGTFGVPKMRARLRLIDPDGREQVILSDGGWRTRPGPILYSSIYGGEDHDARRALQPGEPLDRWAPVRTVGAPPGRLRAQMLPPIRVHDRLRAVAITEPRPGIFVYDLGLNSSGRPVIALAGKAGTKVTITPAELLDPETGLIDQRSSGGRPAFPTECNLTLSGTGTETWCPRFFYTGFRYLQVEGAAPADRGRADLPRIVDLHGEFTHAALGEAGSFTASDRMMEDIHRIIVRAVDSNMQSIMTDCPTREKLGWLEQAHLQAETVFYNRDALPMYEKVLQDMADAQQPDGMVRTIAPEFLRFIDADGTSQVWRDTPEWGAAIGLAAWHAYRFTGDATILAMAYRPTQAFAAYLERRAGPDGLVAYGLGDWYDVGPKPPGIAQLTSLSVTGTATLFEVLRMLAESARILGRPAGEASAFAARAEAVRTRFNQRLFDPATASYDRGSQAANAIPLALGMVPSGREADVLANIVTGIDRTDGRLTTGEIGFRYMLRALMAAGRDDIIYRLMSLRDGHSYGAQLAKGATTLTEAWDARRTSSQNHFMLGAGEGWLYERLAGIRVDFAADPARPYTLRPRAVVGVDHAAARYRSVHGDLACGWKREGRRLLVDAMVPAGARATIVLPGSVRPVAGVESVRQVNGESVLLVGSGRYSLEAQA